MCRFYVVIIFKRAIYIVIEMRAIEPSNHHYQEYTMKRMITKSKCVGFGSEMRSAKCPFEHGCVYFLVNGVEMVTFEGKHFNSNMFVEGKEYDISWIPKERRVMSYPKLIA